jgi:hypothetical protein
MLPTSTQKRWREVDERMIVKLQAQRAACKSSRDRIAAREITGGLIHYAAGGPVAFSCRHHRHVLTRDSVKIQIGLPRVGNGSRFLRLNRGSLASRAPPAAMSDLAEEGPGLALGIIAVESSLPATFLYQRKHRVDRWCCDLNEAAQFLDGGDECIDL